MSPEDEFLKRITPAALGVLIWSRAKKSQCQGGLCGQVTKEGLVREARTLRDGLNRALREEDREIED